MLLTLFKSLFLLLALVITAMPALAHMDHQRYKNSGNHSSCNTLAWIPYWDQKRGFKTYLENQESINYIAFFWYTLDKKGELKKYSLAKTDRKLIRKAQENGTKVLAIVTNLPDDVAEDEGDWDHKRLKPILFSKEKRRSHIDALVSLTKRVGFDGINIDYEALPGSYRKVYTLFIKELAEALHEENKILAIAIHPKTSERNPREDNGSWAQDWNELAKHADQLHFMTYGEHYPSSRPGPIASPRWVNKILNYASNEQNVPDNKLFVGIPFYGEIWLQKKRNVHYGIDVDLTYQDIQKLKKEYNGKEGWDDESHSPYLMFKDHNNRTYAAWFENQKSIQKKIELVNELGLCNFAVWRIGGESPDFWSLFSTE